MLFWGVGYYNAGIKRPFGRSWLIWPIIYIIYAFVGQVLAFTSLLAGESITTTTVPIGNSTTKEKAMAGSRSMFSAVIGLVLLWMTLRIAAPMPGTDAGFGEAAALLR